MRRGWWFALLVLGSCKKHPPVEVDAAVAPVVVASGPVAADVDASVSTRESTALSILLDGNPDKLPERATDPGKVFDDQARDKIAPKMSAPRVAYQSISVVGSLPSEVVQRIVRQNFGRFRLCYEDGLKRKPSLSGAMTLSFVIASDGSVTPKSPSAKSTTLDDDAFLRCMEHGFDALSFPQPEGGVVKVTYTMSFTPPS
jgi:hypothetical protein